MKKKILIIFILFCFSLFASYYILKQKNIKHILGTSSKNTLEENLSEPVLAHFSFQTETKNKIFDSFPHITLKLNNLSEVEIQKNILINYADSIPVMITVETWGGKLLSSFNNSPLDDVLKGSYDKVFKQLCTNVIGNRPNVYFRFDPDMEVPVNRYPWQYLGGNSYIEAFRYFSKMCKTLAPQVKQVWGPGGYPGTMEFYPGDDVVDAASVTIKSDSEMALDVYPKNYPVAYDLMRRLHRLRFIDKPVFILGSKQCPTDSVNSLLIYDLFRHVDREREVIYSPQNFKHPDFRDRIESQGKIEIGLYDPQLSLVNEKQVTVEHLFVDFGSLYDGTFKISFDNVIQRGHNVIVTFEPFRNPDGKTDLNVLENIYKGKYDNEISQLYQILLSTDKTIYLRYAHEMEIPITRYPWQSQNPVTYIKSFRYFMTFTDPLPSNIKKVWGPAGDRGSLEWWPGNDVVDYVSIAIYGLPDKNITDPEKQESFSTIFNRKYWRLRFVDKPLFITEFGVKGPEDYQTKWIEAAAEVVRKNPRIKGINYFNMSDTPGAWGKIKAPDWSITPATLHRFIDILKSDDL